MAVRLDDKGNISAQSLECELKSALEFDVKYKQTDSMKKRAVRTAQSYDDFKNMVACAHLKTLSRKEVESLSQVKKGWKKGFDKPLSESILLKSERTSLENERMNNNIQTVINPTKFRKPKTFMDFERDLNRQKMPDEKIKFLKFVGINKFTKISSHDNNSETLEIVLKILLDHANDERRQTSDDDLDVVEWFCVIPSFDRFDLTKRFLDRNLLSSLVQWLRNPLLSDCAHDAASKYSS